MPHRVPFIGILALGSVLLALLWSGPGAGIEERMLDRDASPAPTSSLAKAREQGHASIVALYVPASSFAYHDEQGRLTGVTVELLRDFARFVAETEQLQLTLHWQEVEIWSAFYARVRESSGAVLGIGNVTITEPRRSELDFSPPYMNNMALLVSHEDVAELPSLEAIAGHFAGLCGLPYSGTLHEARLLALREQHFPELQLTPVTSNDDMLARIAGQGDCFGYIDAYNYWRARHAGMPLRHHPVADDSSEQFGVILPHGSEWTALLDAFFAADGGYLNSARYRTLMHQHLGDELATLLLGQQ